MVSKRGKRKHSREGAPKGLKRRKCSSGETSVDDTTAGDNMPLDQVEGCDTESNYTESQETVDMEENAAVASTEDISLVNEEPSNMEENAAVASTEDMSLVNQEPSNLEEGEADQPGLCQGGDDAPTSFKEVMDTPAVEDADCHTSSTPGKASEEPSPEELKSEKKDQDEDEADKTSSKENTLCDKSVEPVKTEEKPTEESQLNIDQNNSTVETPDSIGQEKPRDIKEENVSDEKEQGMSDEEKGGMRKEDEPSQSPSANEQDDQYQTNETLSEDAHKEIEDTWVKKENEEFELPSANIQEEQYQTVMKMKEETEEQEDIPQEAENMKMKEETEQEQEDIPQEGEKAQNSAIENPMNQADKTNDSAENVTNMEKAQNSANENPMNQADKTNDSAENVNNTAGAQAEQTAIMKHGTTETLPPGDEAKSVEDVNKTQLAQPNQAGDFLDARALGKASTLLESSVGKEKVDMPQEMGAMCDLKDGPQLELEDQHVTLDDKDWAAFGEEFVDLPGSQEVKKMMLMTSQGDNSSSNNSNNGSSRMERE